MRAGQQTLKATDDLLSFNYAGSIVDGLKGDAQEVLVRCAACFHVLRSFLQTVHASNSTEL